MNAVSFDCCGGCIPLGPGQSVQDVIDLHAMKCEERQRFNFLAECGRDEYADIATMSDLDVTRLNSIHGVDNMPIEISGDAIALHKENNS